MGEVSRNYLRWVVMKIFDWGWHQILGLWQALADDTVTVQLENLAIVAGLVGAPLAALGTGIWWLIYKRRKAKADQTPTAPKGDTQTQSNTGGNSVNAKSSGEGGVNIAQEGAVINVYPPADPALAPQVQMTPQALAELLEAERQRVLKELEAAADQEKSDLQGKLELLNAKLADVETAFAEEQKKAAGIIETLRRESNEVGEEKLTAAIEAAAQFEYDKADALFAEISDAEDLAVMRKARAEYGRGEVAEAQLRWRDAMQHYNKAARLNPGWETNLKATTMLWRMGKYEAALEISGRNLTFAQNELEASDPRLGVALNNHAEILRRLGRYGEAEPLFREALANVEAALGKDHAEYGTSLNNLAGLLEDTGQYAEAEPLYREALANAEAALGKNHASYGTSLNNLAGLLKATGRYAEAEPLFREALANAEAALGKNHAEYGTNLNNLAGLLRLTGRNAEAEPLYREALENAEAALGNDHASYGTRLNNLAGLLQDMGQYAEAEPLYREALANAEAAQGKDHASYGTCLNNLAGLLHVTGRYAEAEPLYRKALANTEAALGKDHAEYGNRLNNLALLLWDTERRGEARDMIAQALAVLETALGADHPHTQQVRRNLETMQSQLGE